MHRTRLRVYLVVLILSAALRPSSAHAATLYVANGGTGGHARCTRPDFPKVQAAIDAAGSGDVIVLCAGSYVEQLVVRSKSLHVRGLPGARVSAPAGISGPIILFAGPQRSKLEGVHVSGADAPQASVGIRADGFDFDDQPPPGESRTVLTLFANQVVDVAGVAIFLEESDGAVLSNVVERYAAAGIMVDGNQTGGEVEVAGNVLRGAGMEQPVQRGIVLDECIATVRDNYIADHQGADPETHGAGLWVEFARVNARRNVFADNRIGIRLAPGSSSQIEHNLFVGTLQEGMALVRTHQARISNNRLRATGGDGIVLAAAEQNSISKNDIKGCGHAGLRLMADATRNTLVRNASFANGSFDLIDETRPVANEYQDNQCGESSPSDLCE